MVKLASKFAKIDENDGIQRAPCFGPIVSQPRSLKWVYFVIFLRGVITEGMLLEALRGSDCY